MSASEEPQRPSWGLIAILMLLGLCALVVPTVLVLTDHSHGVRQAAVRPTPNQGDLALPAAPPAVEPVEFRSMTPDEARAYNATIPFVGGKLPSARAFHVSGSDENRERALDCLSAAVLYEAGDDTVGERAVAQVVLNRVRHPAFPNSVCGVVFQGSERSTGCQFTFTCDGALDRAWSDDAWARAREVSQQALGGSVDAVVGTATHYHTDWVVPYWSASLDKIAAVETHLFYRWTGWWGTPPAFRMPYAGAEPRIEALASRFDAHKTPDELASAVAGTVDAASIEAKALPAPAPGDPNLFLVTLDPSLSPSTLPALATRSCAARPYCKFMAWQNKADTPSALPLDARAMATMAFSYLRDRPRGFDKALWNCAIFPDAGKGDCMNRVAQSLAGKDAGFGLEKLPGSERERTETPPNAVIKAPSGLSGVRRSAPAAPATPADTRQNATDRPGV